jgi:hypothetical protein
MKAVLLFVFFSISLFGMTQMSYSKVKIFVTDTRLQDLESIGIPADHGSRKQNTWLITDISQEQIQALQANNFDYEVFN